ncbi:nucleoside hydrolase [Acidicapsa dinghuensis]|uniref:Nucleoside hydrolase n=1 Tax=Acidicapsa dinghuensis TaxID=2218256 RepID=A0ABW1EGW4_9BACT|nr:nucleoside hydrolase [Acidicapsa dinghuensis]
MRPLALILALALPIAATAQQHPDTPRKLVLIDQDGSGPGGSNQMSMLLLLQSPNIQVLGITMVTGNAWRDEEAQHTLRMLELTHHTDIPLSLGAVFPLIRTQQETKLEAPLVGNVDWLGAWGGGPTNLSSTGAPERLPAGQSVIYQKTHGPYEVPPLPEGAPTLKPIAEDGIHFLIRQVHAHPHQVTIFACGPMTDIALAIRTDPQFAELTQGIVLMGGSLNPQTNDPEFTETPRHEFNFWFDPEAASIVLRAPWPRPEDKYPGIGVVVTTVDISLKASYTQAMVDALAKSSSPAAQYLAKFSEERYYMWDEITAAALIDPTLITKERQVYMDVDINHGPEYGNTLTWTDQFHPQTGVQKVHAQLDLDLPRFEKLFLDLMTQSASQ